MASGQSAPEEHGWWDLNRRASLTSFVSTTVALLMTLVASPLSAQATSVIDSLLAVRRGDNGLASGLTQSVTISATSRSYTVGATRIDESIAPFSWRLVAPHVALHLSGTPMRLNAQPTVMRAWAPIEGRADFALRAGDTISVYGRTGSSPVGLDTTQIRAVGAVSTSVLDLASQGLGVPPQIGARALFSFPVGDLVFAASGALEQDATPGGTGATYWLGTTVRGAVSVNALLGERRLTLGADISHSSADSLGGRNQFPGGGAVGLSADLSGPLDEDGRFWFSSDGFYSRPFGNARSDQPTRLIPSGSLVGLTNAVLIETGALVWTPTVTLLHESSTASVSVQQGLQSLKSTLNAGAWSVAGGVSLDIPFGKSLTLSPEIGAVGGAVTSTISQTAGRVIGRRGRTISSSSAQSTQDGVHGFWGGVGLSARF